ncbi:MAG TPA: DNA-3-methyladenine glycosylase 2 family protein [Nevskiaceae bacterium]|nr:DNA-3-methyladenine glycosylase 2 family protein [Nevskiaceae bacterium]
MIAPARIAEAERHLARHCPPLRPLIRAHGPCPLGSRRRDPFAVLCASIISQQLSTKAADTIQQRVEALCGGRAPRLRPARLIALSHEQLRGCGLSNAKATWLRALAEQALDGRLDFRALRALDDEAAIQALDALPGVGRWTAEMLLMFALDRLDVFALDDVGLRRGIERLYNGGARMDDAAILAISAGFAPYRSVASWYLWRLTD